MAEIEPTLVEHSNATKTQSGCRGDDASAYESDSDQDISALALRRRVASDDEDEMNSARRDDFYEEDFEHHEGEVDEDEMNSARRDDFYEEDFEHHEREVDEDEEGEKEEEEYEDVDNEGILITESKGTCDDYVDEEAIEDVGNEDREDSPKVQVTVAIGGTTGTASFEGKKDAEPFVVPTAGAFYMHDDRFRYNGLARPRRSAGGRKLWEAKDEKPWVHDRFEELDLHDEGYPLQGGRGRCSRGCRGRIQGSRNNVEHVRGKGTRERRFDNFLQSTQRPGRGRGIRRAKMDEHEFRESRVITSKVIPASSQETSSSTPITSSMQNPASSQSAAKPQDVASKKTTISSMLKVSSPPFFPTGTALQTFSGNAAGANKASKEKPERDMPQGRPVNTSRIGIDQEMTAFSTSSTMRLTSKPEVSTGLTFVSNNGDVTRVSSALHQQVPKPGPGTITQKQQRVSKSQVSIQTVDQPFPMSSKGGPSTMQSQQMQLSQQNSRAAALGTQSILLQPVQQPQHMQPMNQTLISPGQAIQSHTMLSFPGKPAIDQKSTPGPLGSNSGNSTIGRGTMASTMQADRGSVVYGSSSLTNGLRGVVQFGGQPQAGLGVPTVGAALPGYSSQPQFNFPNNSEVTWIPILASGASNYNPPYISVDGASSSMYNTQQTSQASSFPSTLGNSNYSKTVAASNTLKASQRTGTDDLGQQRRRYSQMTFGEDRR